MKQGPGRRRVTRPGVVFLFVVLLVVASVAAWARSRAPLTASELNYNVQLRLNGIEVSGWTIDSCPVAEANGTGPWLCSVIANGVIENDSLIFLTGQKVQVNLWFEYLKKPLDPATVTLQSVAVGSGFQIVKTEGAVPLNMSGWGYQAGLVLLLTVLPGEHSGSVDVYARLSG